MTYGTGRKIETSINLTFDLDEPPEKVWRAISLPAFRERWLPSDALASAQPITEIPGQEVSFTMRDSDPPFLESIVTFRIVPRPTGGTCLQIVQELTRESLEHLKWAAANDAGPLLMFAA